MKYIAVLSLALFICGVYSAPQLVKEDPLPTPPPQFSYVASVRINGEHKCGAAVVGPQHVLTSSKCLQLYTDATSFSYSVHLHGKTYTVQNVFDHSGFHNGPWYIKPEQDVTIIRTVRAFEFSEEVGILDVSQLAFSEDTKVTVTGFDNEGKVQGVNATVISHDFCRKFYEHELSEFTLCVLRHDKDGPCLESTGFPITIDDRLVGFVPAGKSCPNEPPQLYTDVAKLFSFISYAIELY